MLSIISVLRSYPAAAAQAVSPKPRTSPGRRSGTNATESHTTTAASTKSFTKKSCCLRERPNDSVKDRCSGTLRRKRRPAKTVRPPGVLMPHFRENYPGTNKSTLCGISLRRTSRQRECAPILRFTIKVTVIPMFTFC